MRTTEHIERFRVTNGRQTQYNTDSSYGMNGCFLINPENSKTELFCIVSDGSDDRVNVPWEHVSARARTRRADNTWYERVPNWEEMCFLKDMFWNPDEVVVQFHPKKENYVNIHPNVLHLWRFKGEMPTPPKVCV